MQNGPGGTLEATVSLTEGTQHIVREDPDLLDRIEEVIGEHRTAHSPLYVFGCRELARTRHTSSCKVTSLIDRMLALSAAPKGRNPVVEVLRLISTWFG